MQFFFHRITLVIIPAILLGAGSIWLYYSLADDNVVPCASEKILRDSLTAQVQKIADLEGTVQRLENEKRMTIEEKKETKTDSTTVIHEKKPVYNGPDLAEFERNHFSEAREVVSRKDRKLAGVYYNRIRIIMSYPKYAHHPDRKKWEMLLRQLGRLQ